MTTDISPKAAADRRRILAHDIRNCLNVISMELQMLRTLQHDNDKFNDMCQDIDKERRAATDLFNEYHDSACDAGD